MKFAIYRHNPYLAGGGYRPVLRGGKPVAFATKREAEDWLSKANLTSKDPHTTFSVRRLIKEL